jgi:hypothetical protein
MTTITIADQLSARTNEKEEKIEAVETRGGGKRIDDGVGHAR